MKSPHLLSEPTDPRSQAARWIARLHRPDRNVEADALAMRQWTEADPEHAAALGEATQVWEELGAVGAEYLSAQRARNRHWRLAMAGVAAVVLFAFVLVGVTTYGVTTYGTAVGGLQDVTLSDGSVVSLNTDTRIKVRYFPSSRHITLERGEAYFKVAKNPDRPFFVTSGKSTVRALGTAFLVRASGPSSGVTLVEGQVVITDEKPLFQQDPADRPIVLYPGQHWSTTARRVTNLEPVAVEAALAWRSGRLLFDNDSLADAASEFNRYSSIPIVIETENAARLRVSGIFNSHEESSFVSTISGLYGLKVVPLSDRILLSGTPNIASQNAGVSESR